MLFTTARTGPDRTRRDIAGIRRVPSQVSVDVITRPSCCCCFGRIQIDMQISGERRQISSPADRPIAASTCGESAVIAAGTRRASLCGPADWAEIRGRVAVSMSDRDSVPSTVVSEARLGSRTIDMMRRYCAIIQLPRSYLSRCSSRPFASPSTTHMLFIIGDKQPGTFCSLDERPNDRQGTIACFYIDSALLLHR